MFDRAVDFYGDGSFYLVGAPGHMSGHTAGLARVAPNSLVLLVEDMWHHRDPGVRLIPENMHHEQARRTVAKLAELTDGMRTWWSYWLTNYSGRRRCRFFRRIWRGG